MTHDIAQHPASSYEEERQTSEFLMMFLETGPITQEHVEWVAQMIGMPMDTPLEILTERLQKKIRLSSISENFGI